MIAPELAAAVLAAAEERRSSLLDLCRDLVEARSINPPGDTREVTRVVLDALRAQSIEGDVVALRADMPSVVARLDSGRPGRHLILNVHVDTMPPGDEALWSVDPYTLTQRGGRLYGLGMGNMKGAVAAMVHAVGMLQERRETWSGSITFTAVSDEVVFGEHGAAHLIATRTDLLGDGMICGEGAGFGRLAVGEKGVLWLEVSTSADGGHSSAVIAGESAAAKIAKAVVAIETITGRRGDLPAGVPFADPEGAGMLTANVGTIVAGSFIGQIATTAHAEIDLRVPPGLTIDGVEDLVRSKVMSAVTDGSVGVRRIKGWNPNLTSVDATITRSWRAAERAAGVSPAEPAIRLPASDASRWRARGVPAICFGPQPTLSAGIDDYAEEDEVVRCAAMYTLTALHFLAGERTDVGDHADGVER